MIQLRADLIFKSLKAENETLREEYTKLRKDLTEAQAYNATRTAEVLAATQHTAEREAEIVKLRDALSDLSSCVVGVIEGDYWPDSFTLQPANKALSTPPSTSYLEQWERERYEVAAWMQISVEEGINEAFPRKTKPEKFNADWWKFEPLYARKDK